MEIVEHIQNLPMLGNDTVHIWGIHVPDILGLLDALHKVLCKEEQGKAARFLRDCDRQSSVTARGALRILISGYTGIAAEDISFHYSENGKPYVPDASIDFNISHSGDWVVLAFGRERNIGVDVELIRRDMDVMSIASRYFTPEESARIENAEDLHASFFHHWARKEAYVKATGSGLFRELSSFAVPNEDSEKDGWFFHRLDAGSKYAAAVVTDKPLGDVPCYDFGGLKWDS